MKESTALSEQQIAESKVLFGPAPVLSSENGKCFDLLFDQIIRTLMPRDVIELICIRRFVLETWIIERLVRHGTVAIERRYQESLQQELQRAKTQQARKLSQRTTWDNCAPADIAQLAAVEEKILSVPEDIDEILERKDLERHHNRALEKSIEFQERLDSLITRSTRRRDDALMQLEIYRSGLGEQTRQATERLLACGSKVLTLEATQAPPLAPSDESGTDD